MIVVDTNVLMYAAGRSHPCKKPSLRFLEQVASGEVEAAIDAETLQEILHRYRALGRWKEGRELYDMARRLLSTVLPVTAAVMDESRRLLDLEAGMSARDAVHAAVCLVFEAEALCSWDRDFDRIAGVRRMEPGATA